MKIFPNPSRPSWLPDLDHRVWILAIGRLLSQMGSGFTLFYASIFFVNQVGLSATAVGVGLGSTAVSGIVGRLLAGVMIDSPRWGRRWTLIWALFVLAIAATILAITNNFPLFLAGNLLIGLGTGLYWPANETSVADLTTPEQRNEGYALTRLADTVGLGVGVMLGGLLISTTGAFRALFVIDAVSFLVFLGVVYVAIPETADFSQRPPSMWSGWVIGLRDRALLLFLLVNILFTTYIVQVQATLPLYLSNFVQGSASGKGFTSDTISILFSWHIFLGMVFQFPIVRWLRQWTRPGILLGSACLWSMGFVLTWVTGVTPRLALLSAVITLAVLGMAIVLYTPAASAYVVELAPDGLRGVYLSLNSLCWAIGFLIGPPLGGLAMDQPSPWADYFWLALATTTIPVILVLHWLDRTT
ncbi:MAG: MFS transporter [Cyanobacteria bacterium]|nr:MFS transporter [Cyanobacteriota bacterium]MDW8200214.1 MFS transporter [Cyanobacteriota bacterium SKYGB_h_bin112]